MNYADIDYLTKFSVFSPILVFIYKLLVKYWKKMLHLML